jgi:predicted tellurium resistance membrane protein TerC
MPDLASPTFWIAVLQIIAIDILLGGDNAVVIALACRKLPDAQRNKGIFWGVFGAIGLRVVLIYFALATPCRSLPQGRRRTAVVLDR